MLFRSSFDLSGQVSVVTGGGRGIGLAVAASLSRHGASVVLVGRTPETLKHAAEQIRSGGGRADWIAADVSDEAAVEHLASEVGRRHGTAAVLVNNAGINPYYKAAEDVTLKEWQEMLAVNLTGVFLCCRAFGRAMIAAGSGSIVNISSIAGHIGMPKTAPYSAAKGGVELLTKALAAEWAKKGVRVNCVAPGYVETDLTQGIVKHPVLSGRIVQRTPLGRFAQADEIAGAVAYLASHAASYVPGQSLIVDGGWTAT